jgi:ABC-type branched-subunit amino acid transport system ATPase component
MIVLALTNKGLAGLWRDLSRKLFVRPAVSVEQAPAPARMQPASGPEAVVTGSPIIRIEDVRRAFGGVVAVDSVAFDVSEGTTHGVVGPNGSGKTTLFEILSGFVASDRGAIIFKGRPVTGLAPATRARMGFGRSFQLASILPESTVLENVLVGTIASLSVGERLCHAGAAVSGGHVDRAVAALEVVGLAHLRDREASTLAYGQRKLLDIARVIVARPTLALLDEPLAGVDAISTGFVRQAIGFLRQNGCTVMLVEHNMRFVVELSDRVTVLDAGKVLVTGTPKEATSNPDVVRSYLGERRGGRRDWRRKTGKDADPAKTAGSASSSVAGI